MNPDPKQNADQTHSRKGKSGTPNPLIKAGRVSPLKRVLILTPLNEIMATSQARKEQ